MTQAHSEVDRAVNIYYLQVTVRIGVDINIAIQYTNKYIQMYVLLYYALNKTIEVASI